MQKMTQKQRMMNILKNRPVDMLPFIQYSDMNAKDSLLHQTFGHGHVGILKWTSGYKVTTPNCILKTVKIKEKGQDGFIDTYTTPAGSISQKRILIPGLNGTTGFGEHYIKNIDDYYILLSLLKDMQITTDETAIDTTIDYLGDTGLPHIAAPRTPYQALWIEWVPITLLTYHIYDKPDLLEEVMTVLADVMVRCIKATLRLKHKKEFLYLAMGDNITSSITSPSIFKKWCVPYYRQISELCEDNAIKFIPHMDGDIAPLMDLIGESKIHGIDSQSPPPDNDTHPSELLKRFPNLLVFSNFPSSVHLKEPDLIYSEAMDLLNKCGDTNRFWIQISENTPPERWRVSFPPIMQAIKDYCTIHYS